MQLEIYLFLGQYILFCHQYDYVISNPLVGNNIRHTDDNEFLFVVSVMRNNIENPQPLQDYLCAGSAISQKNILTCEHCLYEEIPTGIKIRAGSNNLFQGENYFVMWWLSFDQWATLREIAIEFPGNDIALIRLLQHLPNNIRPVSISNRENTDLFGVFAETVGWGTEEIDNPSPVLRAVTLRVITRRFCERKIRRLYPMGLAVEERQSLCTIANPYALLSWGDSGGPLLYNNSIIAINIGTCPNTTIGHPELVNLHLGIHYYLVFILEFQYYSAT